MFLHKVHMLFTCDATQYSSWIWCADHTIQANLLFDAACYEATIFPALMGTVQAPRAETCPYTKWSNSDTADAGPRFHQNSGMWMDTQAALQDNGSASGLVTQLDPDATTRSATNPMPYFACRLLRSAVCIHYKVRALFFKVQLHAS